jgi:hypothetical protein
VEVVVNYFDSRQTRCLAFVVIAISLSWVSLSAAQTLRDLLPLIIKGSHLQGVRIDRLEVLAVRGGIAEPIPFQVDSVTDGSYVLPDGPYASKKTPEALSADDQIVIMVSDFGEQATRASDVPADAFEIRFAQPKGGPDRYVYIATVDKPRLSARRYVSYDATTATIETDHYRLGMPNGLPSDFAFQDRIGERRPNIINRFKVRLSTRVMHLVRVSLSEDDIQTEVLAWKAGPVRVVRSLIHSLKLAPHLYLTLGRNDFYYRDYSDDPVDMSLPWAARIFFGDTTARVDLDFNDLRGYELLWSQMAIPPVEIADVVAEDRLKRQPPGPISWIAIRGQGRSAIQALAPSPDLRLLKTQLYFNDDPERPDPPGRPPGEHPGIGYTITGWEGLERGPHFVDSALIIIQGNRNPASLLDEMNTQPIVSARRVRK